MFCSGPQGRPVDWFSATHLPVAKGEAARLHSSARNALWFTEGKSLTPAADRAFVTLLKEKSGKQRDVVVAVPHLK